MKNFILTITRDTIPYVKELRPLAGSIAACIVMQQLDYWFARYPDGFYKFLEPCAHKDYNDGDSFTEELAVSPDEFRTAFDKIGTRHTSKTAFLAAEDKFNGKFYCSYFDKKDGKTFYFRNHDVVDEALMGLVSGSKERPSTVDGKRQLQKLGSSAPVDGKCQLQKPAKSISPISTETNTEIIADNSTEIANDTQNWESDPFTDTDDNVAAVVEDFSNPSAATSSTPTAQANDTELPQWREAIQRLDAFGIANGKARDLINMGGAHLCLAWVNHAEKTNQTARVKIGTGLIVNSIRAGETPPGYVTPEQRVAAQQARENTMREEQAQKAQAAAMTQAEAARLDEEWEDMDFDLRDEIEIETRDRLGVLFQGGRNSAAYAAMRRQVQREAAAMREK